MLSFDATLEIDCDALQRGSDNEGEVVTFLEIVGRADEPAASFVI